MSEKETFPSQVYINPYQTLPENNLDHIPIGTTLNFVQIKGENVVLSFIDARTEKEKTIEIPKTLFSKLPEERRKRSPLGHRRAANIVGSQTIKDDPNINTWIFRKTDTPQIRADLNAQAREVVKDFL